MSALSHFWLMLFRIMTTIFSLFRLWLLAKVASSYYVLNPILMHLFSFGFFFCSVVFLFFFRLFYFSFIIRFNAYWFNGSYTGNCIGCVIVVCFVFSLFFGWNLFDWFLLCGFVGLLWLFLSVWNDKNGIQLVFILSHLCVCVCECEIVMYLM